MKFLDFLILAVLFVLLGLSAYILWFNLPGKPVLYEKFQISLNKNITLSSVQFYSNMRYRDRNINYSIADSCDTDRRNDVKKAFSIISEKTILDFYETDEGFGEINILCSNIAPLPDERGHFVAGEGGPSEIINTTNFAVIFSGKVSLFRKNECEVPNVAIHEILHALGFDHNNNEDSIMYPITKCDQKIDDYLVNVINELYKFESYPDLAVEKVNANKTGVYLNFEITVANLGLKNSPSSTLLIYENNELLKDYPLDFIDIGTKKILSVYNMRASRSTKNIVFEIKSIGNDLDIRNNKVEIKLIEA